MMPSSNEQSAASACDETVFGLLNRLIDFYRQLATSTLPFKTQGTRALGNIDSYVFSSIQNTLGSIQTILNEGKVNDAYALLRKYSDAAVINIYTNLYLEEQCTLESMMARKDYYVEKIEGWLRGKNQLPETKEMFKFIAASKSAKEINGTIDPDKAYRRLRKKCNDHTHYNFFQYVLLNDPEVHAKGRSKAIKEIDDDLRAMFIWHIAYLFYTQGHYMTSSDDLDYLECGMKPPKNSEYWVAPFVQNIFDDILKPNRPDIAAIIKRDTKMHLK